MSQLECFLRLEIFTAFDNLLDKNLTKADFPSGILDKDRQLELKRNALFYLEIFRRIHKENHPDVTAQTFQIYAGLLMTWAELFSEDEPFADYKVFHATLSNNFIKFFKKIDTVAGALPTLNPTNSPEAAESLLGQWSFTAAQMAHANLRGPYEKFLDLCVKGIIYFPIITWGSPSPALKSPQAISQS